MVRHLDREVILAYVEEARGYLPLIREGLRQYQQDPNATGQLELAHRYIHTIKGASSMVGYGVLGHIAYFAEEVLEEVAAGTLALDGHCFEAIMKTVDAMQEYLEGIVSGQLQEAPILTAVAKSFRRLRQLPEAGDTEAIRKLLPEGTTPPQLPQQEAPTPEKQVAQGHIRHAHPELLATFQLEAEDHLQHIGRLLTSLQQHVADRDTLSELRRRFHTLKGAAGTLGFRGISQLAHQTEDLLDDQDAAGNPLEAEIQGLLFEAADTLEDMLQNLDSEEADQAPKALLNRLKFATQQGTPAAQPPLDLPSSQVTPPPSSQPPVPGPQSEPPPGQPPQAAPSGTAEVLRIPMARLDDLVSILGEMVISRSAFEQYYHNLAAQTAEVQGSIHRLQRIAYQLEQQFETTAQPASLAAMHSPQSSGPVFDALEMDRYSGIHMAARELVETASDINTIGLELREITRDFDGYLAQTTRLTGQAQDKLMQMRMVPLSTMVHRMQRAVRVTAGQQGKEARLEVSGEEVSLDKSMLEEMAGPILHLLRNAVDHGIEPPELRQAKGKERQGLVRVEAFYTGGQAVLQVRDDGGGAATGLIRQKAVERGIWTSQEARTATDEALMNLLTEPGFSTAGQLSEISGRGVGMDVVKATVTRLKGNMQIQSEPGQGMTVSIRLPLTLAINKVLMVEAARQTFALPLGDISQIVRIEAEHLGEIGGTQVLAIDGKYYQLMWLSKQLALAENEGSAIGKPALILEGPGGQSAALVVQAILESRETVIKNLGKHLKKVPHFSGATLLGDGRAVLIINPMEIIGPPGGGMAPHSIPRHTPAKIRQVQILITDDSLSIRKVLSNVVSNAGWQPVTARDGVEALELLHQLDPRPDILLLDIEMPRMDGLELTSILRGQPQFQDLPIIMITSRAADKHRNLAFEAGVNAYVVKPFSDAYLCELIGKHLEARP